MDTTTVPPPSSDKSRPHPGKTTLIPPSPTVTVPPPRPPEAEAAAAPPPPPATADVDGAMAAEPPPPPPHVAREARRARFAALARHVFQGCLTASFLFTIGVLLLGIAVFRSCNAMLKDAGGLRGAEGPFAKTEVADLNLGSDDVDSGTPRVLLVRLRGAMIGSDSGADGSVGQAVADVRRARFDLAIDGILLDVDSPGGEVTVSDELWCAIKDFRASRTDTKVPRFVVALMGSTAASGAYYACSAADWIIARPTTLTGSIGVKIESFNVRKLAEDNGVRAVSVTSGPHKNMLDPFTDLTDEQRRMLQSEVDALQALFVSRVTEGRHGRMPEDRVKALADGRLFLGPEAQEKGLVDAVGHLDAALSEVRRRVGGEAVFVQYVHPQPLLEGLFSDALSGTLPTLRLPFFPPTGAPSLSETRVRADF